MMNESMDLNDIKSALILVAKKRGVSLESLNENWRVNYSSDIQKAFERDMGFLLEDIRLIRNAYAQNDELTVECGMVRAGVRAGILRDFFDAFDTDMLRVLREFEWPKIPENFKIPDHYNYTGPK